MKLRKSNKVLKLYCHGNMKEIAALLEENKNKGYGKIIINCENITYDDMDSLDDYADDILLKYSHNMCTLEEFKSMRATIDYYKGLILAQDLSPLEQLTYTYDLIKSLEYEDSNDKALSREIHSIIKSGKIVCVGYSRLIAQILSELGFSCYILDVCKKDNPKEGHNRLVIRVVDEKYGIDGTHFDDCIQSVD